MHAVVQLFKPAEAFYEIITINKYENPTYAFKANSKAYDNGLANRNTKWGYMVRTKSICYWQEQSNCQQAKVTCTYDSTEPQSQQIHCSKTANTGISSKGAGGKILDITFEWREKLRMMMMTSVRHLNSFSHRTKNDQEQLQREDSLL